MSNFEKKLKQSAHYIGRVDTQLRWRDTAGPPLPVQVQVPEIEPEEVPTASSPGFIAGFLVAVMASPLADWYIHVTRYDVPGTDIPGWISLYAHVLEQAELEIVVNPWVGKLTHMGTWAEIGVFLHMNEEIVS